MSDKKDYSVSEFKANALGLLEAVSRNQSSLTITKRGKPIARVVPFENRSEKPVPGKLAGTILNESDIISPFGSRVWNAAK